MRWSPPFDTFVRYKGRVTSDPLFGVDMYAGETNTSLPENQDLVEVGGTWAPAENFVASLTMGTASLVIPLVTGIVSDRIAPQRSRVGKALIGVAVGAATCPPPCPWAARSSGRCWPAAAI